MKFLEKNLENIIWEVYESGNVDELRKRGLEIDGNLYRQLPLGTYGTPDLLEVVLGADGSPWAIKIYELKQNDVGFNSLAQACRYLTALKSIFSDENIDFRIVLIGGACDTTSDFVFLYNQLDFVSIYVYDYKIDGLYFEYVGKDWRKTNENFAKNLKDTLVPKIPTVKRKDEENNNEKSGI